MRAPLFRELFELDWPGPVIQTFQLLHRHCQRQISRGPDVSPSHRHQQVHIGAPRTNPLNPRKHDPRFVITQTRESDKIQLTANNRSGKIDEVRRLLPRHSKTPQVAITQLNKPQWRERLNRGFEPAEHRLRRLQRHLLLEDDVCECLKTSGSTPKRRSAVRCMYRRQRFVSRGELARRQRKTFLCEWLHSPRVAIVRKFSNRMRPSRESLGCSQRVRLLFQSSKDFSRWNCTV